VETLCVTVYEYLRKQFLKQFKADMGLTSFRNLSYQQVTIDRSTPENSGVFICKQVEILAKGLAGRVDATHCYVYRTDILDKVLHFN
jgi:hypothetical protein